MNFNFLSTLTFEPWDWRNAEAVGIGGSETSHIEMCAALARRGHKVVSFAPTPFEMEDGPEGVPWLNLRYTVLDRPGIWVIYRAPHAIDWFTPTAEQELWLVCQDVDYTVAGDELNQARCAKLSRLIALCETHAHYLRWRHPYAAEKVCVSSNGIRSAKIRELALAAPPRNPRRLMYASSPDRGMVNLLTRIFPRAKEILPELELHVYYGFENIDKVVALLGADSRVGKNTAELRAMLEQPGVIWHGRTGQLKLYEEWLKAGIWCHPSNFTETSCITCMEAQALGAIPITTPTWAIGENVGHGVFIDGDATAPLVHGRYTLELMRMALDPEGQEAIRRDMMPWALDRFDWEHFAAQWEALAAQPPVFRDIPPASAPVISLCHATARLPEGWRAAHDDWFRKAAHPERIEYILAIDAGREAELVPCANPGWRTFSVARNMGRRCPVDAWNAAAHASSGQLLITVSDDWFPPEGWDEALLAKIPSLEGEYVLDVDNGDGGDWLLPFSLLTRAYWQRLGNLFDPEYEGLCADNEFTHRARRDGVVIAARDLKFEHRLGPADAVYQAQRERYSTGLAIYQRRRQQEKLEGAAA